ncbi:MAG: sugar phosphate isomerase/epimerase family protein [Planctomycetota bacterium]|nr:sugar phosphate isomerase/epimerase family protein [Planctomycetota bacterium]
MTSPKEPSRRTVLHGAAGIATGSVLSACTRSPDTALEKNSMAKDRTDYPISLAQWSLHRTIRSGDLDPLDFAKTTRETWDIGGIEYVNSFFKDKVGDQAYLGELKSRAADHDVRSLLIMVDGEGAMGDPDETKLQQTVDNHRRWLEAAKVLDCHSIRVNAQSEGTPDEQRDRCVRGFHQLMPYADELELDVIIENHGGLSSNGAWLASLVVAVNHPRLGTLPDFGNFILDWDTREEYDRYVGVEELMPYARALSAKSHEFDERGEETGTDFARMLAIARQADYQGWVGIEYEGENLSEHDGITRTRDLLIQNGCHTT